MFHILRADVAKRCLVATYVHATWRHLCVTRVCVRGCACAWVRVCVGARVRGYECVRVRVLRGLSIH